jgi:aryl-phospho-beta-D-glucosidase BglC (GH1 family)
VDLLQVKGNLIVDSAGHPIRLRGTCVGGWMNMENFINGYTGAEHTLRATMSEYLGPSRAHFFFERMLDYLFTEEDIAFMKSLGATVVRLPFNYRHFEDDAHPFQYKQAGFQRLDQVLGWCQKYGIYAILDFHAAQGSQNPDWHSDNANRHSDFWQHPHFQDRFVALWEEFARRYKGNATVAGYNILNEPVCNLWEGRIDNSYKTNWDLINGVYRRVVKAIRAIDPDHILFLEGDYLSMRFSGLEAPFADNLVYSSHNYVEAIQFSNHYPGLNGGEYWDRARQEQVFLQAEGTQFTQKYNVPLWVGEFGPSFIGENADLACRARVLDDQIDVMDALGSHWTTWTYKDIGVMSWVYLDPASEYMQVTKPFMKNKEDLGTDFWFKGLPSSPAKRAIQQLSSIVQETLCDPDIDWNTNAIYLQQAVSSIFIGQVMQIPYAKLFKDMSEVELDRVLQSFALKNCLRNEGVIASVRKHTALPA